MNCTGWSTRKMANQAAYTPSRLEGIEIFEFRSHPLVAEIALVLLQQSRTQLRVLSIRYTVFVEGLLKPVERDDDAVDLSQRVEKIAIRSMGWELELFVEADGCRERSRGIAVRGRSVGQLPR